LNFIPVIKANVMHEFPSFILRNSASILLLLQEYITTQSPLNVKLEFYLNSGDIAINLDTIHMPERTLKIQFTRTI
jgi:hypothetical protein